MTMTVGGTSGLVFPDSSTQNTAATGFGFKNRILNGNMAIDQRNAGSEVNPAVNGSYYVDRFMALSTAASKFKIGQNAGSVTPPSGFINYLGATSLSAYTAGASEQFGIRQNIEGLNVADLGWGTANATSVTLSFWVRSSLTGSFGGSLRNSAQTRSYPFNYTVSSANTWEQKTVTIAGDTSGTWLTTNGIGINLQFSLGADSTLSGSAGSWATGNYVQPTGSTSVVGTNGATFYITGVQLEKGSTATSFDYRPYGTELALCQRYYYKTPTSNTISTSAYIANSTTIATLVQFPVTLRTAPTSLEQSGTASDYTTTSGTAGAVICSAVPTFSTANTQNSRILAIVASGLTTGQAAEVRAATSNGFLAWSAEL